MNGIPSAARPVMVARVVAVSINDDTLAVDLEDGRSIAVPIGWYPRLAYGTPAECVHWQSSGGLWDSLA